MDLALLVLVVGGGLGALGLLLHTVLKSQKLAEAADAPSSGETCVACGGRALIELATDAYRCKTCGFEGGSGLAAWKKSARIEAAQKMAPDLKKASALKDLRHARTQLLTADGLYTAAREQLYATVANPGGGFDDVRREFSRLMTELEEARAFAESAAIKLEEPELSRALPQVSAADFAASSDLTAFDRAGALLSALKDRVDRALDRHES